MRYLLRFLILSLLSLLCSEHTYSTVGLPGSPPLVHSELILLELFTSQGCSSCPPADQLLAKLQAEAAAGKLPVVALSYHVDYWNRLGWTDPYSDKAFSARQRTYARKLPDHSVYTPQLIVHGRSGHVGSREGEVRNAIAAARGKGRHTHIQLRKHATERGHILLAYQLDGAISNFVLNVAVVEASVSNDVPKGENRGRHLQHVQVVRDFQQISTPAPTGLLRINPGVLKQRANGQVVVFVQDADSWAVRGVAVWEDW